MDFSIRPHSLGDEDVAPPSRKRSAEFVGGSAALGGLGALGDRVHRGLMRRAATDGAATSSSPGEWTVDAMTMKGASLSETLALPSWAFPSAPHSPSGETPILRHASARPGPVGDSSALGTVTPSLWPTLSPCRSVARVLPVMSNCRNPNPPGKYSKQKMNRKSLQISPATTRAIEMMPFRVVPRVVDRCSQLLPKRLPKVGRDCVVVVEEVSDLRWNLRVINDLPHQLPRPTCPRNSAWLMGEIDPASISASRRLTSSSSAPDGKPDMP